MKVDAKEQEVFSEALPARESGTRIRPPSSFDLYRPPGSGQSVNAFGPFFRDHQVKVMQGQRFCNVTHKPAVKCELQARTCVVKSKRLLRTP
ncbi:hypothetical protein AB3X91_39760 [Paraburkholderia sp. BR14263]|uniref:hypothetical protein n=1 Tax=unclassified Paraburkholderia TaxID=2615204 RepID=UPI0034CF3357